MRQRWQAVRGKAQERLAAQRLTTVAALVLVAGLVLYPLGFLIVVSLNTGDPRARPPVEFGLDNYTALFANPGILTATFKVSLLGTLIALPLGIALAWVVVRTDVPGAAKFERLAVLPFYVSPLVGALAWSILAQRRSGFFNQIGYALGLDGPLLNINSMFGIALVMALFDGAVVFIMVASAMKSMDPALEESSRIHGAKRWRTVRVITMPLLVPAIFGAAITTFVAMLGAFAVPVILGSPARFYVVTTAIYQRVLSFPPDYPAAAAMGITLFGVMVILMTAYRRVIRSGSYATISGKAFRPRRMELGRLRPVMFLACALYVGIAVVLPLAALLIASFQSFTTVHLASAKWTLNNIQTAFELPPIRDAILNSFILSFGTATIGVLLMGFVAWLIYRTSLSPIIGSAMEYISMLPLAVPRMVFGLGLLWAWIVLPIPIYGTLWLLLLAYITVLLPLGVRTIAGVILQLDRSLEECAKVCGAGRLHQLRTVSLPLMRPGMLGAGLLLFVASFREVGASILLQGPKTKVIGPSIVESWASSGTGLGSALALIQAGVAFAALAVILAVGKKLFATPIDN